MSGQKKTNAAVFTTVPKQPSESKPGQLTQEQVQQFFDDGFVIVENYFNLEDLEECREGIKGLVETLAQKLYNGGKIKKLYKEFGLFQRLTKIEKEFPGANVILHKDPSFPQAFRNIWAGERLLNVAEQLLGSSDIMGHPVWNLRTKTPRNDATTVPWHQDVAYLDSDSYEVLQPAAWIPLLDANDVNGCMQMVRGGHRTGKVAKHTCCWGSTHYVMLSGEEMEKTLGVNMAEDVVTCPVPYGGMMLLNNMIPHRSLDNLSNDIRWSLDLRWQRADKPLGFYGIKDGIRMRSSTDPNMVIDWDGFLQQDKHMALAKNLKAEADEFDTTIVGNWMLNWEITHHNRHTARALQEQQERQKAHKP